jgi:hypothetical protein
MTMPIRSSHFAAVLGVAGIAVLVVVLWPTAPSPAPSQEGPAVSAVLSDRALGRAVVEFIAVGFALGALGVGARLFAARVNELRRAGSRRTPITAPAPTISHVPGAFDATASEFDEIEQPQPRFAPIVSLTEAQARRQQRAERERATLNSA